MRKKIKIPKWLWEENISSSRYYLLYTALFIALSLIVYFPFLSNGKTFVWFDGNSDNDGLVQHFNSLVYYAKYLRSIFRNLFFEHSLQVPMWDMSIGYGQDIITTLSFYVVGDPFSFLAVFCPVDKMESFYGFLILLRIYAAGLSFSYYCRYRNHKNLWVLVGALIYCFTSYTLVAGAAHPFFLLPLIYLPLLLVGAEKILNKNGIAFFTAIIALSAISNFYFFYMLCIIVVLYTVLRYIEQFGKTKPIHFFKYLIRFISSGLIGICIAMVILLPVAMSLFSSSRVSADNYIPILYNAKYYVEILGTFVAGTTGSNYYVYLGYTSIAFIAIILLFLLSRKNRKNTFLCAAFCIFLVFLLIPFFGHVFNGMAYVTNRWIWAFAFLMSYIVVCVLPSLPELNQKAWKIILLLTGGYACCMLGFDIIRTEKNILALMITICTVFILYHLWSKKQARYNSIVCLIIAMISIFQSAFYIYSPTEGNALRKYADQGTSLHMLSLEAPQYMLTEESDVSKYRFDTSQISTGNIRHNSSMFLNTNGVNYYFSTANSTVTKFITDMNMNYTREHYYNTLDSRSILDVLLSVKYFIIPNGKEQYLPYGYDTILKQNDTYTTYTSDDVLPIGFTSDQYIAQNDFNQLSTIQKQQALLQGIVVNDESMLEKAQLNFSDISTVPAISVSNGVTIEGNSFVVTQKNATATLTFNNISDSELYLQFKNLIFEEMNPASIQNNEGLSEYEKNIQKGQYRYWSEPTTANIRINSGNITTNLGIRTRKNNFYSGFRDFLCNCGYSEEMRNTMTLTFSEIGTYSYDRLEVISQPMNRFREDCQNLKEDVLENVTIGTNQISGNINLEKRKLLCISIPYSEGWSATVDGEGAELLQADDMLMAIELDAGEHQVELTYRTPYLLQGLMLSIGGIIIFIGILIIQRKKKQAAHKM